MRSTINQNDVVVLARAFGLAWESYCRPGRNVTISEQVARSALATLLVAKAKEGMREEVALSAARLQHLISLTMGRREFANEAKEPANDRPQSWNLHIDNVKARFVLRRRVRISR